MTTATKDRKAAERNERNYAKAEELVRPLAGVTVGYIGNCDLYGNSGYDDRAWYIFHSGDQKVGGYSTDQRGKLAVIAQHLRTGYAIAKAEQKAAAKS